MPACGGVRSREGVLGEGVRTALRSNFEGIVWRQGWHVPEQSEGRGAARTIVDSPLAGLGIGCKLGDDGATKLGNYWHGSIDELVLFNRALTADELRSLARVYIP